MDKIKVYDKEMRTRDERETCFPNIKTKGAGVR